jgi:hypothetical protein
MEQISIKALLTQHQITCKLNINFKIIIAYSYIHIFIYSFL